MNTYRKGSFIAGTFQPGGWSEERVTEDDQTFQVGLAAARILSANQGWDTAWLVGETAKDLDYSAMRQRFSPHEITALRNKRSIDLGDGVRLRFTTRATMHRAGVRHAIVAFHPTEKLLNELDELHEEHMMIVIPWSGAHVPRWARTWGAVNLIDGGDRFERPMLEEPVREALNDLVNQSHFGGLTYPGDISSFRELFKRLKKEGYRFTAEAVRSFVIVESVRGIEVAEKIAKAAGPHAEKEEST
jgi:hypothetical protein